MPARLEKRQRGDEIPANEKCMRSKACIQSAATTPNDDGSFATVEQAVAALVPHLNELERIAQCWLRRLARQEGPAKSVGGHHTGDKMTIIPTRAMQLIERAIGDGDENLLLAARENDVLVKSSKATIYTRLVEGRFPKWRDVFPRHESTAKIELTVGPFHAAVRQAAIVTSEERRGVEFAFGEGRLVLSGHGAEYGESHVELPIAYDGQKRDVMLDPRFVNDFLRVLDPETNITLEIRDGETAVVCNTQDGYAYVIMPLARDQK